MLVTKPVPQAIKDQWNSKTSWKWLNCTKCGCEFEVAIIKGIIPDTMCYDCRMEDMWK
jgi:hypothetical protein